MVFVTAGLAVSVPAELPSGPVIILVAGTIYLLVALMNRLRRLTG
jgi:ABC-type Mn2+/Zn2+ transport system permease subunit